MLMFHDISYTSGIYIASYNIGVTRNGKRLHNHGKIHHAINGKTHYNQWIGYIFPFNMGLSGEYFPLNQSIEHNYGKSPCY